jgi:hypothetical protein
MPRTATITVFQFDELNDKAKEKARNWYRSTNASDTSWSDGVIEDAKNVFAHCGFDIKDIYCRGFWSQGDGACFAGTWNAENVNVAALKSDCPIDVELHRIVDAIALIANRFPRAKLSVKQSGHYVHENCTEFDITLDTDDEDLYDGYAYNILKQLSKDCMRWIYKSLESSHDEYNSDEVVDENIVANEYEFRVDGSRYQE